MNGHDFLSQYKAVTKRIELNRESMLRAEKRARELGGKAEQWASDYQDRLYEETEELIKLRYMIENAVACCRCSENERNVLFKRYIQGKKWTEIADEMLYSVQHLHRLNRSALLKVIVPCKWQTDGGFDKKSAYFIYN
ncbi:MAG: hypothetical protein IJZ72_07795 [Oscillospiraceae bacterium]|nr:hypothetical protein [Oscillospiraceae bacterium]